MKKLLIFLIVFTLLSGCHQMSNDDYDSKQDSNLQLSLSEANILELSEYSNLSDDSPTDSRFKFNDMYQSLLEDEQEIPIYFDGSRMLSTNSNYDVLCFYDWRMDVSTFKSVKFLNYAVFEDKIYLRIDENTINMYSFPELEMEESILLKTKIPYEANISTNGEWVVYLDNGQVVFVNTKTGECNVYSEQPSYEYDTIHGFIDEQTIIYTRSYGQAAAQNPLGVWVLSADGSHNQFCETSNVNVQIASNHAVVGWALADSVNPEEYFRKIDHNGNLVLTTFPNYGVASISSNGKYIAYIPAEAVRGERQTFEISIYDYDSEELIAKQLVTLEDGDEWPKAYISDDGKTLTIWVSDYEQNSFVYRIDIVNVK